MRYKSILLQVVIIGIVFAAGIMVGKLGFAPEIAATSINQINVPKPLYPINENGQTYGSNVNATSLTEPDLVAAVGVDGTHGYVKSVDLNGDQPQNPQEAIEYNKKHAGRRQIPLYAVDGKTVIGVFEIGGGLVTEIPAEKKK